MTQDHFQVRLSGTLRLAFPMSSVETVVQVNPRLICPIPGLPVWLLGVMGQRGTLTWVMDLSRFLEVTPLLSRPGRDIPAIVLKAMIASQPERNPSLRSMICLVSELNGIFVPTTIAPFSKPLKPNLKVLFTGITQWEGQAIAVVNPESLMAALYQAALPVAR